MASIDYRLMAASRATATNDRRLAALRNAKAAQQCGDTRAARRYMAAYNRLTH